MAISRANGDEQQDKLKQLCDSLASGKTGEDIVDQAVELFGQENVDQLANAIDIEINENTIAFAKAECEKLANA